MKVTATGALESGRDGIKKAASGLSSGIKTVTNKIPLPKSPKAFRRRSWHAYDELEEHICEHDSVSDEENTKVKDSNRKVKKDKPKKEKVENAKEKSPKSKKGRKNGKKRFESSSKN